MMYPRPLLLAGLAAGLSCSGSDRSVTPPPPPLPAATIDVTPSQITVPVAAAVQLNAVARDSLGALLPSEVLTWSSANGGVARVGIGGQVTGVAPGQTWVRAGTNGVSDSASVTVSAGLSGTVLVTPQTDSVAVGAVIQLRATVRDTSGALIPGAIVTWSSGNTGVATVRPGGFVTGTGGGTVAITASNGGVAGSAQIIVRSGLVRGDVGTVPLIDLVGTYLGFPGGLYPTSNITPAAHAAAGAALARTITPLDLNGQPSSGGSYVLLSLGPSVATQEWCTKKFGDPCTSWSFTGQAAASSQVRKSGLRIINGAEGGQFAQSWLNPTDANYDRVRDSALVPAGLSEKQVQIVWINQGESPTPAIVSLPQSGADAFTYERDLGKILRAAKVRYPNLRLAYITSPIYAGYSSLLLLVEPFAYEEGFSVKWLVDAQERQMAAGGTLIDPTAGDLNYANGTTPWVSWGPYLWANGAAPRSDGLAWPRSDFEPDGLHPSTAGETKVGGSLLTFFLTAPTARCWFATTGTCP